MGNEKIKNQCCVCGLLSVIKAKSDEDGEVWRYCSEKCFQYKTPPIKRLEKIFQSDITHILIKSVKDFSSNEARLDFLGVTDPTFRTWIKKFFSMEVKDFFIYCGKRKTE